MVRIVCNASCSIRSAAEEYPLRLKASKIKQPKSWHHVIRKSCLSSN